MEKIKHNQFIFLDQSQGGIFKIPFWGTDGTKTYSIGTANCWNCVCVYVPLDEEFCFAAHIDAWSCGPVDDNSDIVPPKGSEESLKNRVKEMLREEVRPFMPNKELDVKWNKRSIILNMRPTVAYYGVKTCGTGFYIAEAIIEFFGLLGNDEDQHATGFVVNHVSQHTEYFRWGKNGVAPTADDFDRWDEYKRTRGEISNESTMESKNREQPCHSRKLFSARGKDWRFGCHKGRWFSKAEMLAYGYWKRSMWNS